jgi:hypothetical protein
VEAAFWERTRPHKEGPDRRSRRDRTFSNEAKGSALDRRGPNKQNGVNASASTRPAAASKEENKTMMRRVVHHDVRLSQCDGFGFVLHTAPAVSLIFDDATYLS